MSWTLCRRQLPLRFVEEVRDIEGMMRARYGTGTRFHHQLYPAFVAPLKSRQVADCLCIGKCNDSPAEFAGAACGGFHKWPCLAELEVVGQEHGAGALETKLTTDGIARVAGEPELESIRMKIGQRQIESLRVFGLHSRVGQNIVNALQIINEHLPP